jgi:hypothetical protein
LITELLETPNGAGVTAALAAVVRPNASVVPIRKVRIILYLLVLFESERNDFSERAGKSAGTYHPADERQMNSLLRLPGAHSSH